MLSEPLTLYKLMVLYMLKNVKFPLTYSQISEFFLGREYTNYFTLQQAISELTDAHLVKPETIHNITRYEITREGEETLVFFGNTISEPIREDISAFLSENKIRMRNEIGVIADYYKTSNSNYTVTCEVREGKTTLIQLSLSVPGEEEAELVCDNWNDNNSDIYGYIMTKLLMDRS